MHLLTEALQDRKPSLVHDGPKATRDHSTICDVFSSSFSCCCFLYGRLCLYSENATVPKLRDFFFFFFTFWLQHGMWGLSSLTKDRTQAPCVGSMEFQPVGHQGSPSSVTFEERDPTHWWESPLCRSQGQSWRPHKSASGASVWWAEMEEESRKKEGSYTHAHPQAHLEIRWLHLVSLEKSLSPTSCSLFSPDGPLKVLQGPEEARAWHSPQDSCPGKGLRAHWVRLDQHHP